MFYHYTATTTFPFNNLMTFLPDRHVLFYHSLWISVCAFFLFFLLYRRFNKPLFSFFLATVPYTSMFILTARFYDENFVNFRHPFMLYHHGLFSFSSVKMVDGTVEFLYFLLHTPFAFSLKSLIWANVGIGYLVGYAHLALLWKFANQLWPSSEQSNFWYKPNFVLVMAFSLYLPAIWCFSNGYGNGMISLLFLTGLYFMLQKKWTKSSIITGAMPLFRPESVLYNIAIIGTDLIENRKFRLSFLLPFFSLGIYLLTFKWCYGHFIPTPILFKNLPILFSIHHSRLFISDFLPWFFNPGHMFCFVMIGLGFSITSIRKQFSILFNFIPFLAIILGYTMYKQASYINFGTSDNRYILPIEIWLFIIGMAIFLELISTAANRRLIMQKILSSNFFIVGFLSIFFVVATDPFWSNKGQCEYPFFELRAPQYSQAGQFFDQMPETLTIGCTELNMLGYFMDRPLIDLFGYTNRYIATSTCVSNNQYRIVPNIVSKESPDIIYCAMTDQQYRALLWNDPKITKTILESTLSPLHLYPDFWPDIRDNYDLYILNISTETPTIYHHIYVKKSIGTLFQNFLAQKKLVKATGF